MLGTLVGLLLTEGAANLLGAAGALGAEDTFGALGVEGPKECASIGLPEALKRNPKGRQRRRFGFDRGLSEQKSSAPTVPRGSGQRGCECHDHRNPT